MKRILPTDPPIPNTIDREAKRALKERSIVSHEHVVFDLHDESWTRDGREDSPVSATLVGSIILSHDTDNRWTVEISASSGAGTVARDPSLASRAHA